MLWSTKLLIASWISASWALFPLSTDRFVDTNSFKVSSVITPSEEYEDYLKTLSTTSKDTSVSVKTSNTSSNSSSTAVLNLIPGISLLQTDTNNECYFVNTTIGDTVYPLIIDTGSAYLWVYGEDCDDEACEDELLYTATADSSTTTSTSSFALAYVTGTASGQVVEDNIIVNKLATTEKFRFGMADTVPDFFEEYPVSGIFGLPSNDSSAIESIISALYESNAISKKRFSISLGSISDYSNTSEYYNSGIFAIGDPIEELYEDDIHYTDLLESDSHYWIIVIDQVSIDSFEVTFNESVVINDNNTTEARTAIIDTGTTVLALPKQDALDIHSYFTDSVTDGTNFAIYCNSTLEIELSINDYNWTVGPDEYLGEAYPTTGSYAGYCVSNIQGVDSSADTSWILGSVFLKTVYADFDVENQQIGFAKRNTNVELTSTATSSSSSSVSSGVLYSNGTLTTSATASGNSSSTTEGSSSSQGSANYNQVYGYSFSALILMFVSALIL